MTHIAITPVIVITVELPKENTRNLNRIFMSDIRDTFSEWSTCNLRDIIPCSHPMGILHSPVA